MERTAMHEQPQVNEPGPAQFPAAVGDLEKLARWVPKKEMAFLIDICERAQHYPDLLRPALLLCQAYAEIVARMLDQDPLPSFRQNIAQKLQHLRFRGGL
jgi:hypothetical protein